MIKLMLNELRNIIKYGIIVFLRYYYWKLFFGKLGRDVKFYGSIKALMPYNISVGDNCTFNDYVVLNARDELIIGNQVSISPGVIINSGGLVLTGGSRHEHFSKRVIIEDGVWLGSNAIILPGVIIGKNSVIGAGAVVTKTVSPNSIAVGVPARIIRMLP